MEAIFESVTFFIQLFNTTKGIVDEINLDFTNEGIEYQAIDSSHVSLVSLKIPKISFLSYQIQKRFNIGINLASILLILKCADSEDNIKFKYADGDDKMSIIFSKTFADSDEFTSFDLKLIEINQEVLAINDQKPVSEIRMSSKKFAKICSDFQSFSDTMKIVIQGGEKPKVNLTCEGDKANGNKKLIHKDADMEIRSSVDEFVAAFSLRHLNLFAKAHIISPIVVIQFNVNAPVILIYPLPNNGKLSFFLAPKTDNN